MNGNKIDELAEAVWRRVIGYERSMATGTCHPGCPELAGPDDCGLYRAIWDEINTWATGQTKEGANG